MEALIKGGRPVRVRVGCSPVGPVCECHTAGREQAWQPPDGPASLAAIFYTAAILGPAAGYLIGGALLNIYTELGRR